jgi:hypothetical protein
MKTEIRQDNMVGDLYIPNNCYNQKLPVVILISGIDGGIPGNNAIPQFLIDKLIEQNYIVLALAYFAIDKLPQYLENIEIEYFENAINWMKLQNHVDETSINIIGHSRGAELTLILGGIFPNIFKSIIALVPSDSINGGFPYPNKPAWIYKHQPLSKFLNGVASNSINLTELADLQLSSASGLISYHDNTKKDPYNLCELFLQRDSLKNENKQIQVENIICPTLILSGGDDAIWPSKLYCQNILDRLDKRSLNNKFQHINYDSSGHRLLANIDEPVFSDIGQFWCYFGGNTIENNKTKDNVMLIIIEFLAKYSV